MDHLSIDLETFSSVPIQKAGAQKYIQSPDFEILLFAYSLNGAEPVCCDFAQGETLPKWVAEALLDPQCLKHAYNAPFEWGCLSRYMGRAAATGAVALHNVPRLVCRLYGRLGCHRQSVGLAGG